MSNSIAVIDMKAFYAFYECVERGLDAFKTPLVVCDTSRGDGTIVLSVSPYLKMQGVPSRCRKRELPKRDDIIFAVPQMQKYVEKSAEIVSIVLDFVGEDDIHVYSIDELFVNLTPYLKMYNATPRELTKKILDTIYEKTHLVATAGISENMLMAKLALDLDGKKRKPYIAIWTKKDIKEKLWKVKPLSKMWGISLNYERRLNALGIYSVGDLANAPKELLKEKFGVMGEQLHEHANGIDNTNIREKYIPEETSFSIGQTLHDNYAREEASLLIKEMNDDLSSRLRKHHMKTSTISLAIGYDFDDIDGGFSHSVKLAFPTDDSDIILKELLVIFDKYIEDHFTRRLYISYGNLTKCDYQQLSLFEDPNESIKRKNMQKTLDNIKNKYGSNSVLRTSSLLDKSTAKERHSQIGGHKK